MFRNFQFISFLLLILIALSACESNSKTESAGAKLKTIATLERANALGAYYFDNEGKFNIVSTKTGEPIGSCEERRREQKDVCRIDKGEAPFTVSKDGSIEVTDRSRIVSLEKIYYVKWKGSECGTVTIFGQTFEICRPPH
ncbi:MAG: hypothetical protein OEY38_06115 [Gammaproteobacteria bacterium]|nr:hypothetical protein [Gammaproteobacteria bacterium]